MTGKASLVRNLSGDTALYQLDPPFVFDYSETPFEFIIIANEQCEDENGDEWEETAIYPSNSEGHWLYDDEEPEFATKGATIIVYFFDEVVSHRQALEEIDYSE